MTDKSDWIDGLLDEARGEDPAASDALMARIMADAATEMPRPGTVSASAPRGLFSALLAAIGGWAAAGGLAAATVAGLWLGIAPPEALDTFLAGDSLSVSLSPQDLDLDLEG